MDKHTIRKGEKEYIKARETFIIFICNFDLFEDGLGEYNIVNYFIENKKICNDKTNKKIINLKGEKIKNPEVKELIKLFKEKEYNDSDKKIDKLGKRLEEIMNTNQFYRRYEVMQTKERMLIDEGIQIGIEKGMKQGMIIKQIEMLKEFKVDEETIINRIQKEYSITREEVEKYL